MTTNRYTADFNEFWRAWPGRFQPENNKYAKNGKRKAFVEWKRIPDDEQKEIIDIVKSGRVKARGTQFLPDAYRWLKEGYYDDFM